MQHQTISREKVIATYTKCERLIDEICGERRCEIRNDLMENFSEILDSFNQGSETRDKLCELRHVLDQHQRDVELENVKKLDVLEICLNLLKHNKDFCETIDRIMN